MQLPDVNVLIYAHREDAPEHERYAAWLQSLTTSDEPFALSARGWRSLGSVAVRGAGPARNSKLRIADW